MTRLNIPLFVALAASILSAVPVDGRDTLPHQRMIRKRGPAMAAPGPIGAAAVIGLHVRQVPSNPTGSESQAVSSTGAASSTAAATPSSSSSSSTAAAATSSAPTSSAAPTTSSSSSSSVATPSTTSGGLLDGLTSILAGSSTSTTVSTSTTPSTSSTPTPTSTSTTQAQAPQTTQQPAAETPTLNLASQAPTTAARSQSLSIVAVTSIASASAASASASAAAAAKEKTAKITRNTIVSLVVVASCVGGAIAIWTIIRKWKLSPSEKFDDRMQPIDWAPPPANGVTEEAIEEKTKHRRVGSSASHGSFTSGGVGQSEQGHGAKGPMYADSQYGHGYGNQPQEFPPPHDFTAGSSQPGGYGQYYGAQQYAAGPGYADLQRGPSLSESNFSQGANVSRGMSYSRGHGAYDSQSGAVPPMPNPYGGEYGYDDYHHPPAGQQPQVQGQGQAPYRAF